MSKTVKVFSPATIGNIGPGVDVLGLAVRGMGDIVEVWKTPGENITIEEYNEIIDDLVEHLTYDEYKEPFLEMVETSNKSRKSVVRSFLQNTIRKFQKQETNSPKLPTREG